MNFKQHSTSTTGWPLFLDPPTVIPTRSSYSVHIHPQHSYHVHRFAPEQRALHSDPGCRSLNIYSCLSDPTFLDLPAMSPSSSTSSAGPTTSYLEQTVSLLSTVASYMRLPALASTVCHASHLPDAVVAHSFT